MTTRTIYATLALLLISMLTLLCGCGAPFTYADDDSLTDSGTVDPSDAHVGLPTPDSGTGTKDSGGHEDGGAADGCCDPPTDAGIPMDAASTGPDASDMPDSASSPDASGTPDSAAPPDAAADSGSTPPDSGGNSCTTTCSSVGATSVSCTGDSCSYTCEPNHSDCNVSLGNDTDGCECATPGCCATGCQTTHGNGVGDDWYDCVAPNTYDDTQAMAACIAFVGEANASQCVSNIACVDSNNFTIGHMTCSEGSSNACDCWGFDGTIAGEYSTSTIPGANNCICPYSAAYAWH